jgi:hypothetical protein
VTLRPHPASPLDGQLARNLATRAAASAAANLHADILQHGIAVFRLDGGLGRSRSACRRSMST